MKRLLALVVFAALATSAWAKEFREVVLTNQYLRVVRITLEPAGTVAIGGCSCILVTLDHGRVVRHWEGEPGDTGVIDAGTATPIPPGQTLRLKNTGRAAMRFIIITLLGNRKLTDVGGGETRLEPGKITPPHAHPGPHLFVALTPLQLLDRSKDRTAEVRHKHGDVAWFAARPEHTLRNTGSETARFLTIEFNK